MATTDREFLFLSCNARDASRRKGPARAYNARRHVQLHREQDHGKSRSPAAPIQIRFRSKLQCHLHRSGCACQNSQSTHNLKITPVPLSETESRASHLTQSLSMLCLEDNIVSFVPSRLGHSDGKLALLDCGTDALISLMKSPRTLAGVVIPSRAATKGYIQALAMLRSCVSLGNVGIDECIGAIGLLGMFDTLVRDRVRATVDCFKHWRGVSAIICQDPLNSSNSVFAQAPAAPTGGGVLTFIIPCFQGRASPFDGAAGWSEMPLLSAIGSREAVRLNRVSYRLFVRLPRLVCLVRQWKDGELSDPDNEAEMRQLASELTASEDRDAEFRLLDRTLACPTQDPATSRITPESIRMTSAREAATALCYWQTRIMALKLMDTVEMSSTPYRHTEETRLAMNILKVCEYTESCGYCATASVAIALVTVWLVFGLDSDGQGTFTDDLAESILRTLGRCWSGAAIGGTREELDKAANVLVGGKLEGYLCDIVR